MKTLRMLMVVVTVLVAGSEGETAQITQGHELHMLAAFSSLTSAGTPGNARVMLMPVDFMLPPMPMTPDDVDELYTMREYFMANATKLQAVRAALKQEINDYTWL